MNKGFTLIELVVVIVIIAILYGVILFGVTQYINTGKDSNVSGNLVVLSTAGENYYNGNNNSYENFCDSSVVENARNQIPVHRGATVGNCRNGLCCNDESQTWAACVKKFTDLNSAFCVDSRGGRVNEIEIRNCTDRITNCTYFPVLE